MQCPICHVDLQMAERQEIEIDYCPRCRGVWLDRGELDKIIERASDEHGSVPRVSSLMPDYEKRKNDYRGDDYDDDDRYRPGYPGHYDKRRRKSFLDDLFDIFD